MNDIGCPVETQSVLSYLRKSDDDLLVILFNFTPIPQNDYRIGVPEAGVYEEIFNSDAIFYGGSNIGNRALSAEATPWMGRPYSLSLTIPPLAGIILGRVA